MKNAKLSLTQTVTKLNNLQTLDKAQLNAIKGGGTGGGGGIPPRRVKY